MSNLATVKAIYEAFGRGDIPFILEQLSDDVEWEKWTDNSAQKVGLPYLRSQRGKSGAEEFFSFVPDLGIRKFEVLSLMEGGNQIAAEIEIEAANFSDEEIHLWTFDAGGKVVRFRHYLDTAKHIAAGEKAPASSTAA